MASTAYHSSTSSKHVQLTERSLQEFFSTLQETFYWFISGHKKQDVELEEAPSIDLNKRKLFKTTIGKIVALLKYLSKAQLF